MPVASDFGILRAKGRVTVAGKALPFVVQAVGRRVDGYFARDRDGGQGRLVVIGMAGLDAAGIAARLGGRLIDGMHLLRVEDGGSLYDSDEAVDLGQPPATSSS